MTQMLQSMMRQVRIGYVVDSHQHIIILIINVCELVHTEYLNRAKNDRTQTTPLWYAISKSSFI